MHTATIDAALERLRTGLSTHLGAGIELQTPRVRFDATGWTVRIEARDGHGPTTLWLRGPQHDGSVRHAAFSLSHPRELAGPRRDAIDTPAREAADAIADAITTTLDAVRPMPAETTMLTAATARQRLGRDGPRFAPSVEAFVDCYGQPLHAVALPGDPIPSVAFPDVAPHMQIFMRAPSDLHEDVRNRAYLRDLGFDVDPEGRVRTVPMPEAYLRRRAALRAHGGFAPRLLATPRVLLSPRRWLSYLADGVLPINISGRWAHRALRPWRRVAMRLPERISGSWHNHFHALAHDMSVHVLAMHRIRPEDRRTLCEAAMRGLDGDRATVLHTAAFFEGELARVCRDLLAEVDRPEDFDDRFAARLPGLLTGLASDC